MSVRNTASRFHLIVHLNVTSYTIHRHVPDVTPPSNFISYDHKTVSRKGVLKAHIVMLPVINTAKKKFHIL